jgi:hypothetical protein
MGSDRPSGERFALEQTDCVVAVIVGNSIRLVSAVESGDALD